MQTYKDKEIYTKVCVPLKLDFESCYPKCGFIWDIIIYVHMPPFTFT